MLRVALRFIVAWERRPAADSPLAQRVVVAVLKGRRFPAFARTGLGASAHGLRAAARARALYEPLCRLTQRRSRQIDFTSPPSIRKVEPVIQRAPGDTRKAMSSAISSGSP
jgi:hypothetical protein